MIAAPAGIVEIRAVHVVGAERKECVLLGSWVGDTFTLITKDNGAQGFHIEADEAEKLCRAANRKPE